MNDVVDAATKHSQQLAELIAVNKQVLEVVGQLVHVITLHMNANTAAIEAMSKIIEKAQAEDHEFWKNRAHREPL